MKYNKFTKVYNQILNDENVFLPCEFGINQINSMIQPKYKWFGIYQILNQYVQQQKVTPIPKVFFIDICKHIKTKEFQILKYTYQSIAKLLDNYQYELAEDFKNNLINGSLYIISTRQISDNLTNDEMLKIYNIISNIFDQDDVEKIIYECSKSVSGITSSLKTFDLKYNDIFIFINQNKIIKRSWTTTIQHELTHFIHRIVGYDKALKRSVEIPSNGFDLYLNNKDFFNKIFNIKNNEKPSNNILEFIKYIIKPRQQDTSIKHIVMQFQRQYERNNKEISSYKDDPKLKQNINQRLKWLAEIIDKISNLKYYQSIQWKNNLLLITNKFENLTLENKLKYNFIHAIIGYIIYDKILFKRNIKQIMFNHFKKFKYRDN